MKIALFYGTCTGKTEAAAEQIKEAMEKRYGSDVLTAYEDVSQIEPADLMQYDVIIAGIPTWDVGELQYDWGDIHDQLDSVDLSGRKVLLFGTGDQGGYPDTYQDAIGMLYNKFIERGAIGGLGFTDPSTHEFTASKGLIDGKFCGLALDEDCQPTLSEGRIEAWVEQIGTELGLPVA